MKKLIFIFSILLYFSCSSKTEKKEDKNTVVETRSEINKIIIHHADFNIFTTISIPCEVFERAFQREMRKDTITNKDEIFYLEGLLSNLKPIEVLYGMNARAKLFLASSQDTTVFCLDSGNMYSNGVYYKVPEELVDYIEKLPSTRN